MKHDIAMRWADELVNRTQGIASLRRTRNDRTTGEQLACEECCLGVLCDLSGLGEWVVHTKGFDGPVAVVTWAYTINGQYSVSYLPPDVAEWAGTDLSSNPRIGDFSAATLNDGMGADFIRIGHMIRENWATI